MLTRAQLLQLADEAGDALQALRERLADEGTDPPPLVAAQMAVGLAAVRAKLARLRQAVLDATE